MAEQIIIHPQRGHLLEIKGKFYKLVREEKSKEDDTLEAQVYEEVDAECYFSRIKEMAEKLAGFPEVKMSDVLLDVIKDMPLADLDRMEIHLAKEVARAKKAQEPVKVRSRPGHCTSIEVGEKHALLIRE